jgi:signal transduction histidine kinase
VADTGIGIPKEEQENIFKRFYRVDKSRSKETGGVGLGLSIVEWIAHAHHGRIEVDTESQKGSTFTVYLPIQKA